MPRKTTSKENPEPASLLVPQDEARQKLQDRIDKGIAIKNLRINTHADLEKARDDRKKWDAYNVQLLTRLFSNSTIVDDYQHYFAFGFIGAETSLYEDVEEFKKDMNKDITKLESYIEQLELFPSLAELPSLDTTANIQVVAPSKEVFIVHGQDDGAKEAVARFILHLDLTPKILHEQANAGRTIIEKFESIADNVGFAVILMTPDDVGYPKDKTEQAKPRARQNVILELGYFYAKLGRSKVCALYKEGVEIPSDIQGILYIPLDAGGVWKFQLAKELKNAGLQFDPNKLL